MRSLNARQETLASENTGNYYMSSNMHIKHENQNTFLSKQHSVLTET